MISVTTGASKSAFSFDNHVGMLSGPDAFAGLNYKFLEGPEFRR